jgi:hypothetical protein
MGAELVRPVTATFWELRGAWATGRRVSLTLDADVLRAEGHVTSVAATDAYVKIGDLLIPAGTILAVHRPSRLGDSDVRPDEPWAGRPRAPKQIPGQHEMEMEA